MAQRRWGLKSLLCYNLPVEPQGMAMLQLERGLGHRCASLCQLSSHSWGDGVALGTLARYVPPALCRYLSTMGWSR